MRSTSAIIGLIISFILTVGVGMWGCPQYDVYSQRLSGEAELARAGQNRQIKVSEAQAALEAAHLLNEAEVVRAQGLARAAQEVIGVLGGPEAYLRYLWIQNMEHRKGDTIYVPTESGLPVLESGRLAVRK